jgi:hypothetical protein
MRSLDKFDFALLLLLLLVPPAQDALRVGQVHPDIADRHWKIYNEEEEPEMGLGLQVEDAGDDAQEMEDLIPETQSLAVVTPSSTVHRIPQNEVEATIGFQLGMVAIALRNHICHHRSNFQHNQREDKHCQPWFEATPPEKHQRIGRNISYPIEAIPEEGALVTLPGYDSINVVQDNAHNQQGTGLLRSTAVDGY